MLYSFVGSVKVSVEETRKRQTSCKFMLRVQNEQFSEEKGFILRYTEKEV